MALLHEDIDQHLRSDTWDKYWERPINFSGLPEVFSKHLGKDDLKEADAAFQDIEDCYRTFSDTGYLAALEKFFLRECVERDDKAPWPVAAMGAGFSSLVARGYIHEDYEGHSQRNARLQTMTFLAMTRIFKIPVTSAVAYDPAFIDADLVILASLGIHAYKSDDYEALATFTELTVPTLFYAPGAEQDVAYQPLQKSGAIENLLLATWDFADFVTCRYFEDGAAPENAETVPGDPEGSYRIAPRELEDCPLLGPFIDCRCISQLPPYPHGSKWSHTLLEDLQWIPTLRLCDHDAAVKMRLQQIEPVQESPFGLLTKRGSEYTSSIRDEFTGLFIREIPRHSAAAAELKQRYIQFAVEDGKDRHETEQRLRSVFDDPWHHPAKDE